MNIRLDTKELEIELRAMNKANEYLEKRVSKLENTLERLSKGGRI